MSPGRLSAQSLQCSSPAATAGDNPADLPARVTRISDDDPAILRLLADQGLCPGSTVTVRTPDANSELVLLEHDGGAPASLPQDTAAALWLVGRG